MPNWCANTLTITSDDKTKLDTFLDAVKCRATDTDTVDTVFSFNKVIPMPEELRNPPAPASVAKNEKGSPSIEALIDKYGYADWYAWSVANWGTKWDAYNPYIVNREEAQGKFKVIIDFETAWTPPTEVITELIETYPELHFKLEYCEGAEMIAGIVTTKDDLFISNHYTYTDPEYKALAIAFGFDEDDAGGL